MGKKHQDILSTLHGWIQQCRKCGTAIQYDPYSKNCERCGEGNLDIFYKCPECGAMTNYGRIRCSGCKKKISYLPGLQSEESGTPSKIKKKKILKSLIAFSVSCSLILVACSNILIAIPIGLFVAYFVLKL